jgi:hypothetical protein
MSNIVNVWPPDNRLQSVAAPLSIDLAGGKSGHRGLTVVTNDKAISAYGVHTINAGQQNNVTQFSNNAFSKRRVSGDGSALVL